MKGEHVLTVRSKKLSYKVRVQRNISILQGNSGTGKTTMVTMIMRSKRVNSPYTVECDVDYRAFTADNFSPEVDLTKYENMLLFFDEDVDFTKTKEFAEIVKKSSCYFIIVSRERLAALPYSCRSIFKLQKNMEVKSLDTIKNDMHTLYNFQSQPKVNLKGILSCVIVEDSKAGYEFFKKVASSLRGVDCISAYGNSNVCNAVEDRLGQSKDTGVLVIVDGAAIGPYYESIRYAIRRFSNTVIWLPESFEYILLQSSVFKTDEVEDILAHTCDYVESSKYFSWERFFTHLLTSITDGTDLKYSKSVLNPAYTSSVYFSDFKNIIPESTGLLN